MKAALVLLLAAVAMASPQGVNFVDTPGGTPYNSNPGNVNFVNNPNGGYIQPSIDPAFAPNQYQQPSIDPAYYNPRRADRVPDDGGYKVDPFFGRPILRNNPLARDGRK